MGRRRQPIKHGTIGGYRAHYRHGVPMCEACRQKDRDARGTKPFVPATCGSPGGYEAHYRNGTDACDVCTADQRDRMDDYRTRVRGDGWRWADLVPTVRAAVAAGEDVADVARRLGVTPYRANWTLTSHGDRHAHRPPLDIATRLPVDSAA